MPRTVTVTPDSGVFRASVTGSPNVTAAGNTEADALVTLANRIQEHGWEWEANVKPKPSPAPAPLTPSETDANPANA